MGLLDVDWHGERHIFDQYLVAIGIVDSSAQNLLFAKVVPGARELLAKGDNRRPEQILCGVLLETLTRRFRELVDPTHDLADAEVLQEGRLALTMADLTTSRQRAFAELDKPILETDFLAELQEVHQLAGPQSIFAELRPAPLELGRLPRLADSALSELDRTPNLRMAVLWLAAFAFFGGLFFLTR